MAYTKQNFVNGNVLDAKQLIAIEEAILNLEKAMSEGTSSIKYVESNDNANLLNLRDFPSGTYVLSGRFRPYSGSSATVSFASALLVNIITKTAGTHVQVFYPVNNCVQFLDITDDSYKRTNVYLNDLLESIGSLSSLETTDKTSLVNAINEVVTKITTSNAPGIYIESDPTVFDWAKKELFNKANFVDPANRNTFVTIDGVEYYRYNATADSFEYRNPYPLPGSVQITMRVVAQYDDGGSRICAEYTDGTNEVIGTATGETFTFTTPIGKTLSYIRGNYDKDNWQLIDMSVMSMVALYNIGLPLSDSNAAGGVMADPATDADTIPARIKNGRLFVAGATDKQIADAVNAHLADNPISGNTNGCTFYAEITCDGTVGQYEFTTDSEGKPLSLDEVVIHSHYKAESEYLAVWVNDVRVAYRHGVAADYSETVIISRIGNSVIGMVSKGSDNELSGMNRTFTAGGLSADILANGKIEKIKVGTAWGETIAEGSTIKIYGR